MTPVIGVITGESAGDDAIDICAADRVLRIVKETSTADQKPAANTMREAISEELHQLTQIHPEVLVKERLHRLQYQFLNFEGAELPSDE